MTKTYNKFWEYGDCASEVLSALTATGIAELLCVSEEAVSYAEVQVLHELAERALGDRPKWAVVVAEYDHSSTGERYCSWWDYRGFFETFEEAMELGGVLAHVGLDVAVLPHRVATGFFSFNGSPDMYLPLKAPSEDMGKFVFSCVEILRAGEHGFSTEEGTYQFVQVGSLSFPLKIQ